MVAPKMVQNYSSLFHQALQTQARGDFNEAIELWLKIISDYPEWDEGEPLYRLADAYVDTGEFDKAAGALRAAIDVDPDAKFVYSLASHLGHFGPSEEAREFYYEIQDKFIGERYSLVDVVESLAVLGKKGNVDASEVDRDLERLAKTYEIRGWAS